MLLATPNRFIALCGALVTMSNGDLICEEADANSMLQMHMPLGPEQVATNHAKLMQTAKALVQKANQGDDPTGCSLAADATRTAIEEALASIQEQYTHASNENQIAVNAVEACSTRDVDGQAMLSQQSMDLQSEREQHATCRQHEYELEQGLEVCVEFAQLRNSIGNQKCFTFPDDEIGWVSAVENARNELNLALTQGQPLQEACNSARTNYAETTALCATLQHGFEESYCAHRASCASLEVCHMNAEENYLEMQTEIEATLVTLRSEFQVFKHVECLLDMTDLALAQNTIISESELVTCSVPVMTDGLTIDYQVFDPLVSCESTILTQPPCEASFFEVEYQNFPQKESIEAECTQCPALPVVGTPHWVGCDPPGYDLDNLQPAAGSPSGCGCSQVELQGEYSAGPVVLCESCLDVFRSTDQNSCPSGFKIYSPRSRQDWATLRASMDLNSLRVPHHIIDITRAEDGCGGCTGNAMNSNAPAQSSWRTSDGSPWHLSQTPFSEPNGDYTANCFLFVLDTNLGSGDVTFNDARCLYHSSTYLCQPVDEPAEEPEPPTRPPGEFFHNMIGRAHVIGSFDTDEAATGDFGYFHERMDCASRVVRAHVQGGSCGDATVQFRINEITANFFSSGSQHSWQTLAEVVVVSGDVAHLPTSIWTGAGGNKGWILAKENLWTAATFASSYNLNAAWDYCNSNALTGSETVSLQCVVESYD